MVKVGLTRKRYTDSCSDGMSHPGRGDVVPDRPLGIATIGVEKSSRQDVVVP